MNLIAIKDLKQPRRLKERLSNEKELLLTSDGKPVAVLVTALSEIASPRFSKIRSSEGD